MSIKIDTWYCKPCTGRPTI